ncbi:hypothetical protein F2P81_010446 [Scophthalmus maximus]|uniref:Uncharacterized protein n=1 Tax=Scophthalmus maximus TaxID=52904 RepID=A0A6A4T5T8_SCOMX|nr:hypothetical protein F2P81_010446 [Scophthalmus maximus]
MTKLAGPRIARLLSAGRSSGSHQRRTNSFNALNLNEPRDRMVDSDLCIAATRTESRPGEASGSSQRSMVCSGTLRKKPFVSPAL